MIKNWIFGIAIIVTTSSAIANEVPPKAIGDAPVYTARSGTALSMMGWGITLAVGIAALVCIIPNHTSSTASASN